MFVLGQPTNVHAFTRLYVSTLSVIGIIQYTYGVRAWVAAIPINGYYVLTANTTRPVVVVVVFAVGVRSAEEDRRKWK